MESNSWSTVGGKKYQTYVDVTDFSFTDGFQVQLFSYQISFYKNMHQLLGIGEKWGTTF